MHKIVKDNKTIIGEARIAKSFFSRLLGLMFKKEISRDSALCFYRASSIHTFFMRFPIDIVFLDKDKKIIRISEALRPWRAVYCPRSYLTIELTANKAYEIGLKVGDRLDLVPFS